MRHGDIIIGLLVIALCITLGGCAKEVKTVAIDSFCATAEYRKFASTDSPESIKEAEAWNRYVDLRCGRAKS